MLRSLPNIFWKKVIAMVVHIFVSGVVQGVGFRYSVLKKAITQDVTGWVRNLDDGRVEILAEGTKEQLDRFISSLKVDNNPFIKIDDLEIEFQDRSLGLKKFEVRY